MVLLAFPLKECAWNFPRQNELPWSNINLSLLLQTKNPLRGLLFNIENYWSEIEKVANHPVDGGQTVLHEMETLALSLSLCFPFPYQTRMTNARPLSQLKLLRTDSC